MLSRRSGRNSWTVRTTWQLFSRWFERFKSMLARSALLILSSAARFGLRFAMPELMANSRKARTAGLAFYMRVPANLRLEKNWCRSMRPPRSQWSNVLAVGLVIIGERLGLEYLPVNLPEYTIINSLFWVSCVVFLALLLSAFVEE
jgi:hypothetical protein